MNAFQAIILICLASTPKSECSETSAVDVMVTRVANEINCTMGWQEIIARGALKDRVASREGDPAETYIKTLCRRVRAEP